jgi:uncharacterized membrane protein HdeD (DUF308 family)
VRRPLSADPLGRQEAAEMKNKTALKQSRASVKFLSVAVAILGVLMFVCPSAYTAVPLVVVTLYLLGDAYNIRYIKRRVAKDAAFLDKRIN